MEHSPSSSRLSQTILRLAGLAAILMIAVSVSGCDKEVHALEAKEGTRVYLDDIFYQVQISRQLNPKDVEDSYYLQDQPAPAKGDAYFGVFMRVDNETHEGRVLPVGTNRMKIVTASGDEYEPLDVHAVGWGYAPSPIGKGAMLPVPNTPAYVGPIRGGLVLFRISQASLNNRPLELEIKGNNGKTGKITLDV
ncbi:MAG: hypothetical protein QM648_11540 [Solirubrobacterales bacterium]